MSRSPHVLRRRRKPARRRQHIVQRLSNVMFTQLQRFWNRPSLVTMLGELELFSHDV